jgi:hypothetical protein
MVNRENIISIKYDIRNGEYSIKKRDPITGKHNRTFSNRLTAAEVNFATLAERRENDLYIIWTK